jgi:uncharacterized membrane protein
MKLRKYFLAGLLIILPISLTGYISYKIFSYILMLSEYIISASFYENKISFLANVGTFLARLIGYFLSITTTLFLIICVGILTVNYFGKMIVDIFEYLIGQIPFARTIYTTVKQISELIFSTDNNAYKKVVIVDYPYPGIKSIGFLTNDSIDLIKREGKKYLTLFIPTAPNPTSGFLILVEEDKVEYLNISIEDAFKIVISGGAINPNSIKLESDKCLN